MSAARDLVYDFANRLAAKGASGGLPTYREAIMPGSADDDELHDLLNRVEEVAVHRAAINARSRADILWNSASCLITQAMVGALRAEATEMDPFRKVKTEETVTAQCTEFCTGTEHWHRKEN